MTDLICVPVVKGERDSKLLHENGSLLIHNLLLEKSTNKASG